MENSEQNFWRKCSSCKKPIGFNAKYYVCSVSTCNGQRTGYVFCSVPCWEVHLPGARHKDAAAIEMRSPATAGAAAAAPAAAAASSSAPTPRDPVRKIIPSTPTGTAAKPGLPREVLVIASRLKEYIQARGDMNTSGNVMDVLSDHLRVICDRAIESARADGRKTVMDRDFRFLRGPS